MSVSLDDSTFPGRPAQRFTIYLGVRDRVRHRSLEVEILKRARRVGVAGATVFEGIEGYGASGLLHREHAVTDDRPVVIVVVDAAQAIASLIEELGAMLDGVTMTIDDVEILEL
jgi:PII-like signaling protein